MAGHGFLPNGWIDGSKTTLHAVVMFKCYDGMKFEGASERLVTYISSSYQHFIIHLSLQIARFLQATFVQPLLLEG